MARVAVLTFAILVEPWDHPRVAEFMDTIRHEFLHDHGPSAFAFDLRTPFGPSGERIALERERRPGARRRLVT